MEKDIRINIGTRGSNDHWYGGTPYISVVGRFNELWYMHHERTDSRRKSTWASRNLTTSGMSTDDYTESFYQVAAEV
jgi:hypothetical protein